MKAFEIMNQIVGEAYYAANPNTVDVLKIGDQNRDVRKIALCHMATPDVIRAAADWGADMLITHEPIFYNHLDQYTPWLMTEKKRALLEEAGFPVFRYHDSMHDGGTDEVGAAFLERTGLRGSFDGGVGFVADEPICAADLARLIERTLDIKHVRIVGDTDTPTRGITLALGSRGGRCVTEMLTSPDIGIAVYGELSEWADCEPVRDAAQMGMAKAVIVLGHTASERFGMEWKTAKIDGMYDGAEARYFDCGDIYTFAE